VILFQAISDDVSSLASEETIDENVTGDLTNINNKNFERVSDENSVGHSKSEQPASTNSIAVEPEHVNHNNILLANVTKDFNEVKSSEETNSQNPANEPEVADSASPLIDISNTGEDGLSDNDDHHKIYASISNQNLEILHAKESLSQLSEINEIENISHTHHDDVSI